MKNGEVFGYTQNTGIENAGHQIIFFSIRGSGKEDTVAEDEMEKLLPAALTKPITNSFAAEGLSGTTITTKTFYDTPPK